MSKLEAGKKIQGQEIKSEALQMSAKGEEIKKKIQNHVILESSTSAEDNG